MKKIYTHLVSFLVFNGTLISLVSFQPRSVHAGMIDMTDPQDTITQPVAPQVINNHVPSGFDGWTIDKSIELENFTSDAYDYKQCTWWVYNRAKEFDIKYSTSMGNGGDWQFNSNYTVTTTPQLHSAVSFFPGQIVGNQWQADPTYGHVAFVEAIHPDGSILISQSGLGFNDVINYQIISASDALQLHYVIGK
ncbi:CHAP domain-containing protein [Lactococcus lactis]|uniref:CHAP domain-containing protein n=1 Tax=Lactococcus lactis TaxID=1358 RepID=A0A9X4NJE7_9LACT|nr:CHAP domain-containing protein [Lactococcus lactis]MDG4984582.1 CHAP domain-containing protein [Lactococcus lactis]